MIGNVRDNGLSNRLSAVMHVSLRTKNLKSPFVWLVCVFIAFIPGSLVSAEKGKTENVILITTDGLRWQEVFSGADLELMNKANGGVANTNALAKAFWRDTAEARREALLPFFWTVIAKQGQLYGNQNKGSIARITNDKRFSYPGYNEILTGYPNPEIKSNNKVPNQTPTVLEWLHRKPAFSNSVAAFSAWDVTPFIINRERCGFPVMGGWESVPKELSSARMTLLNELIRDTTPANNAEVYDSFIFQVAREYLLTHRPRVLFVGFLETDHWAHAGRYDHTLETANKFDDYVRRLWETVQSLEQYRGKTTFILTTDHGRGFAPENWKHHGAKIDGAENIWMGFLGPDTPALGERSNCEPITQSQVAATLAAFLGENYGKSVPQAAPPIAAALPGAAK